MIPLRDSVRARRFPLVTVGIVTVNVLAFLWELGVGGVERPLVESWAVVPAQLVGAASGNGPWAREGATALTAMFLHGDLWHLLGNMWFLWIFGDNVEDRIGRGGFAAFYLFCGLAATAAQVAMEPTSQLPMIGASGAVAGVLGAYLRLFPRARVLTLIPVFIFLQFAELPALLFLGLWFLVQLVSSWLGVSGVAWWAHIAGFLVGLALSLFLGGWGGARRSDGPPQGRATRGGKRRGR